MSVPVQMPPGAVHCQNLILVGEGAQAIAQMVNTLSRTPQGAEIKAKARAAALEVKGLTAL